MTVSVTHQKVSAIADDPASVAAGEVVPSDWNATHTVNMASGFLLGRSTAGTGAAEEITVGSGLSLTGGTLAASAGVSTFSAGTTGFTPSVATSGDVTLAGTLSVANGGTGTTTSTGTGSVVLSNSPSLVTPALGTPSSGTVTNLTGTASININGTVGATTPTTGEFTRTSSSEFSVIGNAIGAAVSGSHLTISGTSPTTVTALSSGIIVNSLAPSSATTQHHGVKSNPGTSAGSFNVANMAGFASNGVALGAGSSVTNLQGFIAQGGLTTATNNYGFYSNIAAGANRWNFYAGGTAVNYFAGTTYVGAVSGDQALNVNGAVRVSSGTTANQTSAGTMDFQGGNMRFLVWGASGTQGNFSWWTGAGAAGATQRLTLNGSNNLGLATATFGTSATNTFSILNGTAPTTGVANTVQYYSTDLSAGNTIPSWYTEGTNVGTGTPTADRTIAVRFNGTVYYLLASTIP